VQIKSKRVNRRRCTVGFAIASDEDVAVSCPLRDPEATDAGAVRPAARLLPEGEHDLGDFRDARAVAAICW
jgi:hypothetical protein